MTAFGPISQTILSRAPKYLRGPNIGRFLAATAAVCDTIIQTTAEGLKLSNPLLCDPSAFPALSKDRKIRLYPTEPEASKRYRLSRWRQIRKHEASCYGSMINLQPYFLPGTLPTIRCVHQSGDLGTGPIATWHTLSPTGAYSVHVPGTSNYAFDGQTAKWSRWWVYLYGAGIYVNPRNTYNDGHTYNDGAVWDGIGLSTAQAADVVQLLLDSNPPHAWLAGVALVDTSLGAVDPTGTPTQDPSGWWSLPGGAGAGAWVSTINRPPYVTWLYDNPG